MFFKLYIFKVGFIPVIKNIIPNQQDAIVHVTLPDTAKEALIKIKKDEVVIQMHVLNNTNNIYINELIPETKYIVEVDVVLNDGTIDFEESTFKTLPNEVNKFVMFLF